jgi:hypothetical protein
MGFPVLASEAFLLNGLRFLEIERDPNRRRRAASPWPVDVAGDVKLRLRAPNAPLPTRPLLMAFTLADGRVELEPLRSS